MTAKLHDHAVAGDGPSAALIHAAVVLAHVVFGMVVGAPF